MKDILKFIRRKIFGLAEIEANINESIAYTNDLISQTQHYLREFDEKVDEKLKVLCQPDRMIPELNRITEKFYIALEYAPSRYYKPRWGESHPPHEKLTEIFQQNINEYHHTLNEIALLQPYFEKIRLEYSHDGSSEPGWLKTAINPLDSALIYYFITKFKPKTYLEIGSGVSTLFAAKAQQNHQISTDLISIDPEPRAEVDSVCQKIIREGLETVDLNIFSQLESGDMVFLDGSHRAFMNSDVTVFMLDVLPNLKPGVVVGIHDIHLPFDYPEMFSNWYWNEQYLLAAYLIGASDRIKILMPTRFVSYRSETESALKPILENWQHDRDFWLTGGSFWFTHI